MKWIIENWTEIAQVIAYVIAVASVVVKITPTMKDDNIILPLIKFLSKFIALNTKTPTNRPGQVK